LDPKLDLVSGAQFRNPDERLKKLMLKAALFGSSPRIFG